MGNPKSNFQLSDKQTTKIARKKVSKKTKQKIIFSTLVVLLAILIVGITGFNSRYLAKEETQIPIKEFSNLEYPENPAALDPNYQRYADRKLNLIRKDKQHFDFVLQPNNQQTAKVALRDIDLSLFIPKAPQWTKTDLGLEDIAFTDREWNRQQVSFSVNSEHIEITGGDGFERQNLAEVALARNCLNAGLWEVILFTKDEDSNKATYYQGWFDLPMGHYKNVFEKINNMSYWKHWWKLEHWQDPSGTVTDLNLLRKVIDERDVAAQFPLEEKIIVAGEQSRKVRTTEATNLRTWKDFYDNDHKIRFATFVPPGLYDSERPWDNEYWKIGEFKAAILRNIKPTGVDENLQEIELDFRNNQTGEPSKFLISGINVKKLPQLPVEEYSQGFYMPMGIGVPPFYQSYEELEQNPPDKSPYFSLLLDSQNQWIDHHKLAVDGSAMHLDRDNSNLLHLFLLSYERNTTIAHFVIDVSTL